MPKEMSGLETMLSYCLELGWGGHGQGAPRLEEEIKWFSEWIKSDYTQKWGRKRGIEVNNLDLSPEAIAEALTNLIRMKDISISGITKDGRLTFCLLGRSDEGHSMM